MIEQLRTYIENSKDKIELIEQIKDLLHELSPLNKQPVDRIKWVDVDMVQANDYNPNAVAKVEMKLLHTSIMHDGYTQPVVTIFDETINKYVIIDGFHRYTICKSYADVKNRNFGMLPIVVLNKDINDRMASTIRHNRARGKHSIKGMSNIVFEMLDNGWSDVDICNELGMEVEELIRLKHITGFSKLFENTEYKKAWEHKKQLLIKKQFKDENPNITII
jgi:ParB-like chromosome segregation protein Spo0J